MGDWTSVHNSKVLAVWYASEAENLFNLQYASETYTSWRTFVFFFPFDGVNPNMQP